MPDGICIARLDQQRLSPNAFPFMGVRCDRIVSGVFARLRELHPQD
jgi:hypothetical protein